MNQYAIYAIIVVVLIIILYYAYYSKESLCCHNHSYMEKFCCAGDMPDHRIYSAQMYPNAHLAHKFHPAYTTAADTYRYGSLYTANIYQDGTIPPAYEIKLLYTDVNCRHQLEMLFDYIAKDYMAKDVNIKFSKELVDEMNPYNLNGAFPKLIKIRRDGQVLTYEGYTDIGPINDWILNESIWF